jgi:type II secretory pathway pseudopilin PulG
MYKQFFNEHKNLYFSLGFTVIELLAVVAIFIVITAIILFNVSVFKSRARDSAIKSTMDGMAVASSVYFEGHGNFAAFCNDNATQALYNSIASANKRCKANDVRWVVCAQLNIPSDGSRAWCADETGNKREINNSQCSNSLNSCP